jgi:hypothetical protein
VESNRLYYGISQLLGRAYPGVDSWSRDPCPGAFGDELVHADGDVPPGLPHLPSYCEPNHLGVGELGEDQLPEAVAAQARKPIQSRLYD